MKKLFRYVIIICLSLLLIGTIGLGLAMWFLSEPLPQGQEGPEAEQLADDMLAALNEEAYLSINTLSWTFPGGHHYVWNKKENYVKVSWDDYEVEFFPDTKDGKAIQAGEVLTGKDQRKAIEKAWGYFANDSFWLIAPYKIRDPGTTRAIVQTEEGKGLLVHYASGGVTPGDTYLWILDANNRPKAWKMWVDIIPIGGLRFSWESWKQYKGAWLAPIHQGMISVNLTGLEVE